MKPLKLTMQAFGSYGRETLIDFERPVQNLFLITGDTGAGKSTIFDAIVFALYGEASSSANKKEGSILQSHYADYGTEPFVELTFSERRGDEDLIYTVRRTPQYEKIITRGPSKGETRSVSRSVCLMMPDGTEYPQKEADKKIEEIVGLTKPQFMQVAMIAQGEFMELLRAESKSKKEIFRKLFHTELYQKIAEELNERKKAKDKEIDTVKTEFGAIVPRIEIPAEYERAAETGTLKRQASNGETAVMEQLLEELGLLNGWLCEAEKKAKHESDDAEKRKNESIAAYAEAENLLRFFNQLEKAETELAECAEKEEEIRESETLSARILAAYEIKAESARCGDAKKARDDTEAGLKKQKEELPKLKAAAEDAKKKETETNGELGKKIREHSAVSEKTERALRLFEEIEAAAAAVKTAEIALEEAEKTAGDAQAGLETLNRQEAEWKAQAEALSGTERLHALWETESARAGEAEKDLEELNGQQKEIGKLRKKAKRSEEDYRTARENYAQTKNEYETKRQAFLDAQAGFLAKGLKEGQPCPVCGSTVHPHPCAQSAETEDISREAIEELSQEAERLNREQERLSGVAGSDKTLLAEREKTFADGLKKLCEKIGGESAGSAETEPAGRGCETESGKTDEIFDLQAVSDRIKGWKTDLDGRGERIREDREKLAKLRESLSGVGDKRKELESKKEEADAALSKVSSELAGKKATLANCEKSKEYPTREDAKKALKQAEDEKNAAEELHTSAKQALETAKTAVDGAESLIASYTEQLPALETAYAERKAAYEELMRQKDLSESEWKPLVELYKKEDADSLKETADEHRKRRAAAETLKRSAIENIGDRKRPDPEALLQRKEQAQTEYERAREIYERYRDCLKTDRDIYGELEPKIRSRSAMLVEHARLDHLYQMVSGKVSGSRMDLETYVQRYYLEKILDAANRRFREMSAGQFELRMVSMERAGEGKNRGLDLMVYSAVTGREREVRTLSGGESFMAALALALGTADQIRAGSASINLDIMFIDEGFGSLDEHSRNQAVKVLLEMAEGSKLIGIISHVTELKQEIDDQLIVTRDESGSHAQWKIS